MTTRITCGGCDNTWTGLSKCHCSGCHRTFSGISGFDRHRKDGKCLDPSSIINRVTGKSIMELDGNIWIRSDEYHGPTRKGAF